MNFTDYQHAAMSFALLDKSLDVQLENVALGLIGEVGEIADLLKKHRHQGHDLDRAMLVEEVGDVCWYVALGVEALGVQLDGPYGDPRGGDAIPSLYRLITWAGCFVDCVYFQLDPASLQRALQRMLTYLATFCQALDIDLHAALDANIAKLAARFPEGKFSSERSRQR